jgi:DNA-binding beta-propeller fold protein YncE
MFHLRLLFPLDPLAVVVALTASIACESNAPPSGPAPSGTAPFVEFTVAFGEPPLVGEVRVSPYPDTIGWRYRVEIPGADAIEGIAEGTVSIPYRMESLGSHRVRVELIGPHQPVVIEKRLVVTDPDSDFEVLDLLPVEEIWPGSSSLSPEGIVTDFYGFDLYVANYSTGEIVRVDAATFEPHSEPRFRLAPGVEGLALTPSGQRLLAIHKHDLFSMISIPDASIVWVETGQGGSYVEVLDESHALVSGFPLRSLNLLERRIEHQAAPFNAGHFAVDRTRGRVAVSNRSDDSVELLDFLSLSSIRLIPLAPLHPTEVAFDPDEDKLYVVARDDAGEGWFLVVDPSSGARLATIAIGAGSCSGYCAANPVATFAEGRYVAFEQSSSVLVVDTDLDQPGYRFGSAPDGVVGGPAGVAAARDSDVLFVLGGPYDALTKIRLRNP